MGKSRMAFLLIVVSSSLLSSCGSDTPAAAPSTNTSGFDATFTNVMAQVITPYCVSCHVSGGSGGFALVTYDDVMTKVVASSAATSSLYTQMAAGTMPPSGTQVSAALQSLVLTWINAGALNN